MIAEQDILLPTPEQQAAIELFAQQGSLKINAFAGSGKTATLAMLARYSEAPGLYLAFNRSAAEQARRRFPESVVCQTIHSFAAQRTPGRLRRNEAKMFGALNANAVAQALSLNQVELSGVLLTARAYGYLALETLRNFVHGDSTEIDLHHVPDSGRWGLITPEVLRPHRTALRDHARALWNKMCEPNDPTPLGHDGYLKRWALSDPDLHFDFVMLDEAQDSNPVVLNVLAKQQCQVVYVGDQYQQIYEWRGAVNAMQSIATNRNTFLTESFRFGPSIAQAATTVLRALGEQRPIRGSGSIASALGPLRSPMAMVCKTNAELIARCLRALDEGVLPYLVGGTYRVIRSLQAVTNLKRGVASDVPEFFGFKNWPEVVEYSRAREGANLKTFVQIVEAHGEHTLISALSQTAEDEGRAGVILSTAHKAKGLEWETVQLADDFRIKTAKEEKAQEADEYDAAELRLIYVAMTRARRALDLPTRIADEFGISETMAQ